MLNENHEIYKDSNKMAMEYAKDAIRFAFFLNGAAATALFAKANNLFVAPAATFAWGAAFAVFCMGFSYLMQLALAETWQQEGPLYDFYIGPKIIQLTIHKIETGRAIAILLWIISMVNFGRGACAATEIASKLPI